MRKTLF